MVFRYLLFVFTELLRQSVRELIDGGVETITLLFDDKVMTREVHGELRDLAGLLDLQHHVSLSVGVSELLNAMFYLFGRVLLNRVG